jgi:transposase
MDERSGGATAPLGMVGLLVLSMTEDDGEVYVLAETRADLVGCSHCGVRATGHGRSVIQVRDLPAGGRPVRLVVRKRRWLCTDPDCPARTFTETIASIEGSLTGRAAKEIYRRVGQDGASVAQVAPDFGTRWETAMACVRRHGKPLANDPERVTTTRGPRDRRAQGAVGFEGPQHPLRHQLHRRDDGPAARCRAGKKCR